MSDEGAGAAHALAGLLVVSLEQALAAPVADLSVNPQLRRLEVATPGGEAKIVAPPVKFRRGNFVSGAVLALGQHTDSIRREFLS